MRYLSVCSGIEAATVAWAQLGWSPVAFSEIEPFPCAVLAHHYPDVPNLGDMTLLPDLIRAGLVEAPDILCGGTPCQAFSVAGLRRSLDDERGNLSLTFCEIADAIDHVRGMRGQQPSIIFWENVPGVLSTKDNAFGCFLASLAGEDCELKPPGKRWTDAGCVFGPARTIAWRVLDAQYFGLAQRRRRVFVVASARAGFDPAAVLFEFEGVRRDTPPRREARQVAPTIPARSSGGGGLGTDFDCDGGLIACAVSLRGDGFDSSEDGTGRGTPLVPIAFQAGNLARGAGSPPNTDVFPTLKADHGRGLSDQHPCVAFPANLSGTQHASTENLSPALGAVNPTAVAFAIQAGALRTNPLSGPDGIGVQADLAYTLEARAEVQAVAFAENTRAEVRLEGGDGQRTGALSTGGGQSRLGQTPFAVRRLTCEEAEFLQGFPRGYTAIPWRGKPADQCPDGPRYKALGNSWAVPVVRWIGERINAVEQIRRERKTA